MNKIIDQLPLLKELILDHDFVLYGGFLRFVYSFYFENDRLPSTEDILEYLKTGDIDLRYRFYRYERYRSISSPTVFFKFLKEKGVHIEFMIGINYSYLEQSKPPKEIMIDNDSVHFGYYKMWTKMGEQTVRYDLTITDEGRDQYWIEYSVNRLKYDRDDYEKDCEKDSEERKLECKWVAHTHIRDKVIHSDFNHQIETKFEFGGFRYETVLRLWRIRKLWKLGYRPDEKTLAFLKRIWPKLKEYDGDTPYISSSDQSTPSTSFPEHFYTLTRHTYRKLDMKEFFEDPIIQEVEQYLK